MFNSGKSPQISRKVQEQSRFIIDISNMSDSREISLNILQGMRMKENTKAYIVKDPFYENGWIQIKRSFKVKEKRTGYTHHEMYKKDFNMEVIGKADHLLWWNSKTNISSILIHVRHCLTLFDMN